MIYVANKLTLNTDKWEVTKGAKEIELTKTEFRILTILMSNKGFPVSREEILKDIKKDTDTSNYVDVYVQYLRNKLGKNVIKTIRGVGYKIRG